MRDAQIEDIAKSVGINRAIVYRHFTGKEELFALTLVGYLDELTHQLHDVGAAHADDPVARLSELMRCFARFGAQHPAFVDCAQALMRRSGEELLEEISEGAIYRLGKAMSAGLTITVRTIEQGVAAGTFACTDPVLTANLLYASGLGTMQLARMGLAISEEYPGVPGMSPVTHQQVEEFMVSEALSQVGIAATARPTR